MKCENCITAYILNTYYDTYIYLGFKKNIKFTYSAIHKMKIYFN